MLRYKNIDHKVEDIDEEHRKVLIYVSEFNSKDTDGDIIMPGAFKKTISERGPDSAKPRIKHFRDHWDLVGKPIEMKEDEKGLLVLSQLSNSTKGKDLIEDYKLNLLEHSIGYEIIKSEQNNEEEIQYLTELKLWEYSSVTWGANENTPLVTMKGYSQEDILSRINNKIDSLTNALKKGNYSEERFEQIEYQLMVIKKSYNDYISSLKKKPSEDTSIVEPDFSELGLVFENFKKQYNGRKRSKAVP